MAMSIKELQLYYNNVSSMIFQEDSTIKGLNNEKLSYNTLIGDTTSTISGLELEQSRNNLNLVTYANQSTILIKEIADLTSSIDSYTSSIDYESSIMRREGSTIIGLYTESNYYSNYLFEENSTFNYKAKYYSTLYSNYTIAKTDYANHQVALSSIAKLWISTSSQNMKSSPPKQVVA
jgi:hypothetical protein